MQGVGFHLLGRESKLDRLVGAGEKRLELRGWSASIYEALGLNPSTIWCMPVILVLGRWKFKAILRRHSKLEASLGYVRPYLKNNITLPPKNKKSYHNQLQFHMLSAYNSEKS